MFHIELLGKYVWRKSGRSMHASYALCVTPRMMMPFTVMLADKCSQMQRNEAVLDYQKVNPQPFRKPGPLTTVL